MFNYTLIKEIRQRESIRMADFAKRLGITEPYLSMLEKGRREPSVEVIKSLVRVTEIPFEKWVTVEPSAENEEISWLIGSNVHAVTDIKSRLNREHRERQKAEERVWELEQTNEHLIAEIRLRGRFGDIVCAKSLSKDDKMKKLKILATWTMQEGELCFSDLLHILKVERNVLRNWLDTEKQAYECRFVDSERILASSPGEAALCLRCFDCEAFEAGECLGHGDEQRPENIMELLNKLKVNGVYDGAQQSQILEKYYGISLSPSDIANIRYRYKEHLPIPEDVLYLDIRKKK